MQTSPVYIVMFGGLPRHPTGLAMSVLRRVQTFAKYGVKTEILIDGFSPDFDYHLAALRHDGSLPDQASVRSMFSDLAGNDPYPLSVQYHSPLGTNGWEYTRDSKREEVYRGRERGEYKHFVWYRRGEKVHFIDHLSHGRRSHREWFDEAGRASKVELMGDDNKPHLIRYLDRDGRCYLEEVIEQPAGRQIGFFYNPIGGSSVFFASYNDLFQYWMQNFVLVDVHEPKIISEYATRRVALQTLEKENGAKVVYTVHSNHLGSPHRYGARVRPDMRDLFDHIEEYSGVIVLTEEQRQDIWKQWGYLPSIHVVSHHLDLPLKSDVRDPKRVVMVGRFDRMKGHADVIHAFAHVVQEIPEAVLELYGRGPEEEAIAALISKLGLDDRVFIMGFTEDADQVFAGAAISVVASEYEGFCLSLAESMAQGCVPVSYAIKYGPKEIIRSGVDGLLVEPGNVDELSAAIRLLLASTKTTEAMSVAAREVADRYSEERFMREWSVVWRSVFGQELICSRSLPSASEHMR